ncbi:SPOR domain-containing protein [Deltaproteobacteria bacterium]|nr:SPOR domain-containing protein [Deltaproteobacteria bacterium]
MPKTKSKTRGKAKRYKIELTSLSALLWCVFLFFLLIWVFVLGILVGRGFLPGTVTTISELKSQITKLQEMVSIKEPYDSSTPKETEQDPKLAFYEKLASKKDEVKNNWKPEADVDELKDEELPPTSEALQKSPEDEKVLISLPEKEESKPSISTVMYTVQLASIGDLGKAEKLIKDLIAQGYDAYFYEIDVKGKTYYRIRCGRFASRNEALIYAQEIEKGAGLKGFVSRID